ncbi:GNAT family N-acetyltransferase [Tenacibaculum discolor]|uniref:GNAT family N-acetyltransferase n=1 Tax=Tenacibaculum discolor TaxID=361581 RepID=A0A2G1BYC1_9FLAO|nr:GNAT family N-acetyltransferase [Tenacibaculum discolor]MDP2541312.1 GNAT family N-acetyltransferase [Tenacibaculum discolor]PHN99007.1 GNAT family N-acetyltransferase [Tenacibaculum discolor]
MKIILTKFTESDFSNYFKLVNNEKVMEMITERAIELEEAKKDFEKLIENNRLKPSFGNFKILNEDTNEFLGLAKLKITEANTTKAELGYMLLPEYWGKGIASSVGRRLIEIGKKQNSLKRIFAIIDPKNIPSRKVLTNNGFYSKEFKDFDGLPGEILELNL